MRALAAALVPLLIVAARRYDVGPPPAHTGGFGEPSCEACHFGEPLNEPSGSLRIEGLPASFEPGETYRLAVALSRPDLARAGFELSARSEDGKQAGTLRPADGRSETTEHRGVVYIHQTLEGTEVERDARACWAIEWTAPEAESGPVLFHAAANAADGDGSQFGDHVYTHAARAERRE